MSKTGISKFAKSPQLALLSLALLAAPSNADSSAGFNVNRIVIALTWLISGIVLGGLVFAWYSERVHPLFLVGSALVAAFVCVLAYRDLKPLASVRQIQHSGVETCVNLVFHPHAKSAPSSSRVGWFAFHVHGSIAWLRLELFSGRKCTLFLCTGFGNAESGNQNLKLWSRRWLTLIQMKTSLDDDISASPASHAAPHD